MQRYLTKADQTRLEQSYSDLCSLIVDKTSKVDEGNRIERLNKLLPDFRAFCYYYFPHICTSGLASFHLDLANNLKPLGSFSVNIWARGLAKTSVAKMAVIWLAVQNEFTLALFASATKDKAAMLLQGLQSEFEFNARLKQDFGITKMAGHWKTGDFAIDSGIAFRAFGKGQNPRGEQFHGHRPDLIVADDIDDAEECRSEKRLSDSYKWLMESLYMAGDAKRLRFLVLNNLIAQNSLTARLAAVKGALVSNVNIADADGRPSWDRYSRVEIARMIDRLGYRSSQQELFNNPFIEGEVFKVDSFRWSDRLMPNAYSNAVAYIDPSWQDRGDYKAVAVVARMKSGEYHVTDFFCRQTTMEKMVKWCYDLWQNWPTSVPLQWRIEGSFNQHSIVASFNIVGDSLGKLLPLVADKGTKAAKSLRIIAIADYFERGEVFFNNEKSADRDYVTAIEQLLSFQQGSRAHDDGPDALEGALSFLQQFTRRKAGSVPYVISKRRSHSF